MSERLEINKFLPKSGKVDVEGPGRRRAMRESLRKERVKALGPRGLFFGRSRRARPS